MSRRIKDYPYNKYYKDTLEIDADTVEKFEFPDVVTYEVIVGERTSYQKQKYQLKMRASETEKGIFVHIVSEDDPDDAIKEIVIDEIEFADSLYHTLIQGNRAETADIVNKCSRLCLLEYIRNHSEKIFVDVRYSGNGTIYSGSQPIVLFDTLQVKINDNKSLLWNLEDGVGNVDLLSIPDIRIEFVMEGDTTLEITEFSEVQRIPFDIKCSYILKECNCRQEFGTPYIPRQQFEDEQQWLADRTQMIQKTDRNDAFAAIDDLL